MYIKNYSDVELVAEKNDDKIKLPAGEVIYLDDNIITFTELYKMFGEYVAEITDATIIGSISKNYLPDYQQSLKEDKLYLTRPVGQGMPRLYISEGSVVKVYYSDSETKPSSIADMVSENRKGAVEFEIVPRYICFDVTSGTNTEIIVSYMECIEESFSV